MKIFERYIANEFIAPFLFGVCTFSATLIGGGTIWRIAQYISQSGASGTVVGKLFFYSLPGVIAVTIPMAALLASLVSVGRLSASGEIMALRTCGVSFFRMFLPILLLSFFISLAGVLLAVKIVPASTAAYNNLIRSEIENNNRPRAEEHLVLLESAGLTQRVIYARRYDPQTKMMDHVTVQELENGRLVRIQQASRAVWQQNRWIAYDGTILDFTGSEIGTLYFSQQNLPVIPSSPRIPLIQRKPEELTVTELMQCITGLNAAGQPANVYQIELHQRFSLPFAGAVFTLIGLPLGLAQRRVSSSTGLGISILIIFAYYIIMTGTTVLGRAGMLPAAAAAWLPDGAGLCAGLFLVSRVTRRE